MECEPTMRRRGNVRRFFAREETPRLMNRSAWAASLLFPSPGPLPPAAGPARHLGLRKLVLPSDRDQPDGFGSTLSLCPFGWATVPEQGRTSLRPGGHTWVPKLTTEAGRQMYLHAVPPAIHRHMKLPCHGGDPGLSSRHVVVRQRRSSGPG